MPLLPIQAITTLLLTRTSLGRQIHSSLAESAAPQTHILLLTHTPTRVHAKHNKTYVYAYTPTPTPTPTPSYHPYYTHTHTFTLIQLRTHTHTHLVLKQHIPTVFHQPFVQVGHEDVWVALHYSFQVRGVHLHEHKGCKARRFHCCFDAVTICLSARAQGLRCKARRFHCCFDAVRLCLSARAQGLRCKARRFHCCFAAVRLCLSAWAQGLRY